jgi:hypothetical protein
MTGYYIEIGYLSGYSWRGTPEAAWDELKASVVYRCDHPEHIVAEAVRLGAVENDDLREHAEEYRGRRDLTLKIVEQPRTLAEEQEGFEPYIQQFASGDRVTKEIVRRAFCRLVIEDMHRLGIEVNLKVA